MGITHGMSHREKIDHYSIPYGDCILWTGGFNADGYGKLKSEGRWLYAHRLSYELANGPIEEGVTIDHACHNEDRNCEGGVTCLHRRCINPKHLRAVSRIINSITVKRKVQEKPRAMRLPDSILKGR